MTGEYICIHVTYSGKVSKLLQLFTDCTESYTLNALHEYNSNVYSITNCNYSPSLEEEIQKKYQKK